MLAYRVHHYCFPLFYWFFWKPFSFSAPQVKVFLGLCLVSPCLELAPFMACDRHHNTTRETWKLETGSPFISPAPAL